MTAVGQRPRCRLKDGSGGTPLPPLPHSSTLTNSWIQLVSCRMRFVLFTEANFACIVWRGRHTGILPWRCDWQDSTKGLPIDESTAHHKGCRRSASPAQPGPCFNVQACTAKASMRAPFVPSSLNPRGIAPSSWKPWKQKSAPHWRLPCGAFDAQGGCAGHRPG